jgi:hypothetical protein
MPKSNALAADRLDVAMVGAAAAAQHVDMWQFLFELAKLAAQFVRIAVVEFRRFVQLGVAGRN